MPLACSQCRRINPAEAAYCYYDGAPLPGSRAAAGPLHLGSRAFLREFVFPSGRCCRNFDELALACAQDRTAAMALLKGGYVESFLGGIGRTDLAAVARQAAQMPDPQRGLEALLERLPTQALQPPRLQVEPMQLNLGQLAIGGDHDFAIHLTNHGMKLLQGTIYVEETPWLSLSAGAAVMEKTFTVDHELELRVHVLGKRLKASKKPQLGKLLIESNGGTAEVVVQADVPIQPFPHGILAGAQTQRQLAELAFKQAKEAAVHFERGEVARWYAANGWQYPVQAPTASGLAALQQFLEACGLTQAPKVTMETPNLHLRGAVGERLEGSVRVKAVEKKPAFAYAWSDRDWLVPRPARLKGTSATIPVEVPRVPQASRGSVLAANLTVVANGRQRFVVPVRLEVGPPAERGEPQEVLPADPAPEPPRRAFATPPTVQEAPRRHSVDPMLHLLPTAVLLLILAVLALVDALRPQQRREPTVFDVQTGEPLDDEAYLDVGFSEGSHHNFGIVLPVSAGEKRKKLTFDEFGRTNNTVVRVAGQDFIFGREGRVGREHRNPLLPISYLQGRGWKSHVDFRRGDFDVRVTQDVSLRRADQTGKLATCLIRYAVVNNGSTPQRVGLRFMLDTFIGDNDGVPFTIPGRDGLCDTMLQFDAADKIPDFIQALERPDLQDPGTVAHLTLKIRDPEGKLEMPSRVLLTSWPNSILGLHGALGGMTRWNVPMSPIKHTPPRGDSCVVIYWDETEMRPGQTREMAVAYGVGQVTSTAGQGSGKLALTIDGTFRPGGEFTVTAYVNQPESGQQVAIEVPSGLRLVEPTESNQAVRVQGGSALAPVTWRVRADRQGEFDVVVRSGKYSQGQRVRIRERSFLD